MALNGTHHMKTLQRDGYQRYPGRNMAQSLCCSAVAQQQNSFSA
jgi:hypothetical protein